VNCNSLKLPLGETRHDWFDIHFDHWPAKTDRRWYASRNIFCVSGHSSPTAKCYTAGVAIRRIFRDIYLVI
jgi:hypothetical protein